MLHCFKTCMVKVYVSPELESLVEIIEDNKSTVFSPHNIIQVARYNNTVVLYITCVDVPTVISLVSNEEAIRFYNIMRNYMRDVQ